MLESALLFAAMAGIPETCPPKPPDGMVARSATFGGAIAPTTADVEVAVAAGIVARLAAQRFLGLEAPSFLIAEQTTASRTSLRGCAFVFAWPFSRLRGGGSRLPTHVLPHEIGHELFIRFLVPRTGAAEYGGAAPDWLDEMAALSFEDVAGVRMRRADALRFAERREMIPLARLLSMPHPEWMARPASGGPPTGSPTDQPRSSDTPAFYATVRALLDFLIARTGDEHVIRLLAEQVRGGARLDSWLLSQSTHRAVADGLAGLDGEIVAFVLADPAYKDARKHSALSFRPMRQKSAAKVYER